MKLLLLVSCCVLRAFGATWQLATLTPEKIREPDYTFESQWNYQIYEVEWHSNRDCTSKIANTQKFDGGTKETDQSNAGNDIIPLAFDGDDSTAYKTYSDANSGKCGVGRYNGEPCYWVGMGGLGASEVKCVKVFHGLERDYRQGWVHTVARWDGQENKWEEMGSLRVKPGWNKIVLNTYATNKGGTACLANQRIQNGKCEACPRGGLNPVGDDAYDWNSECTYPDATCVANFHVKNGYCQACPSGSQNNAGDKTVDGDTECDDNDLDFVFEKDMGVYMASETGYGGTKGKERDVPRKLASATCGSKYYVAFTSQTVFPVPWGGWNSGDSLYGPEGSTYGHIAEFRYYKGGFTFVRSFKYSACREIVDIKVSNSANGDCSVISALCFGEYQKGPNVFTTSEFKNKFTNFKKDMVAEFNPLPFLGINSTKSQLPTDCNKPYIDILGTYLMEWNTAGLTQDADTVHLINTAIGGSRKGDHVHSTNKDATMYMVDLETTAYGGCLYHEGNINMAWDRAADGTLTYNKDWSRGWSIGSGHTLSNKLAFNNVLENFGVFGLTDDPGYSRRFGTVPDDVPKGTWMYKNNHPSGYYENRQSGGTSEIVSWGSKGYVGSTTGAKPTGSRDRSMLALAKLPGTAEQFKNAKAATDTCNQKIDGTVQGCHLGDSALIWLDSLIRDGYSAAYSSVAHFGVGDEDDDNFLVGWAEYPGEGNYDRPKPSGGFFVARVQASTGAISNKQRFDNTGWRDQQDWLFMPTTGCVTWPGVWNDLGPKEHYGGWSTNEGTNRDLYSTKLQISEWCPSRNQASNGNGRSSTGRTSRDRMSGSRMGTRSIPDDDSESVSGSVCISSGLVGHVLVALVGLHIAL